MPGCMRRGCLTIRRGCGAVAAVVFSPGWRRRLRAGAGRTGVRIRFPYVVPRPKNVQERGTVRIIGTAGTDLIWFHCASLGEFEQGRPVIEAFRAAHPGWKILLTFFSPSGYEVRKNYAGADYIFYLPADTPRNARRFVSIFRPKIAVFVKYEFWANYLFALQRSGARAYLISGIFRPGSRFLNRGGGCSAGCWVRSTGCSYRTKSR